MMSVPDSKKQKNTLIVCWSVNEIRRLSRMKPDPDTRYILASDDAQVHAAAGKYPWIRQVSWLEKAESFYPVTNEVMRILDVINDWLRTLAEDRRDVPVELLFWVRHCEGGLTTQRIQDALLLIRSYFYLIDTYNVTDIILLRCPQALWEGDVFVETSHCRGIRVKDAGSSSLRVLAGRIEWRLKIYAREAYYVSNVFRTKCAAAFKFAKSKPMDNEIVFQLCSSAHKHVENVVPIMKAVKKRGYAPIALCWSASERYTKSTASAQVQREGLRADELERWMPFRGFHKAFSGMFRSWRSARKRKKEFLTSPALCYDRVSLGRLLWPSMHFFFMAELPQRMRIHLALKTYFQTHLPLAAKLWGNGILIEGELALKNMSKEKKPLFIDWFLGHVIDYPYEPSYEWMDLFLVPGPLDERHLNGRGVPSRKIVPVGTSRYDHFVDFKKKFSAEQSRSFLRIPGGFSTYILYDPNAVMRGFLSVSEQVQMTGILLEFSARHACAALIVKPHPAHKDGYLELQMNKDSLPNVFLVDKNMLPYHALNASDVLITKFSTLGVEAMLFERPVISVLLDGEERFKTYGDAADYVKSEDALRGLLERLEEDREYRRMWTEDHVQRQKEFLKDYFVESSEPAAKRAARAVDACIREHAVPKHRPAIKESSL